MLVLGIESTCDETAASIVKDGVEIISQVVTSQIDLHEVYGGVVPELACRRHMEVILPVIREALELGKVALEEIDLIAVSYGPGLIGPLFVGIQTAKGLALALDKPLVGVNHVEAHLYAAMMSSLTPLHFPALGIVLSGGHTALVKIESPLDYRLIGQTADDALGEAFDKVAKMLGLPYPGGPEVETLAKKGNAASFSFKAGQCKDNPFNFSFSGLKTAVLYALREKSALDLPFKQNLCASFQRAAFTDILHKVEKAAELYGISTLIFGGGVTNNQALRTLFEEKCPHFHKLWPSKTLSLDNASMIAGLGFHVYLKEGKTELMSLEAKTRIPFKSCV